MPFLLLSQSDQINPFWTSPPIFCSLGNAQKLNLWVYNLNSSVQTEKNWRSEDPTWFKSIRHEWRLVTSQLDMLSKHKCLPRIFIARAKSQFGQVRPLHLSSFYFFCLVKTFWWPLRNLFPKRKGGGPVERLGFARCNVFGMKVDREMSQRPFAQFRNRIQGYWRIFKVPFLVAETENFFRSCSQILRKAEPLPLRPCKVLSWRWVET